MTSPTKTLRNKIKDGVKKAIDKARKTNSDVLLISSFPFESDDLLPVLTHPADKEVSRIYWEQPEYKFSLAGLGTAKIFSFRNSREFDEINEQISFCLDQYVSCDGDSDISPIMIGGHSFNLSGEPDSTWAKFPRGRIIIPECLAISDHGSTRLLISNVVQPNDKYQSLSEDFLSTCVHYTNRLPVTLPPIQYIPVDKYRENPDWPAYEKLLCSVLKKIKPGHVDKVVISRSHHVKVGGIFRAISAIQVLRGAYHGCTTFLFSFPGEGVFFGSTPERLIKKKGSRIETEALAGTMARGRNMEEDRLMMEHLMESHKEREEHSFVVRQIQRKLKPFVSFLDVDEKPGILKLKNVHHLRTEIRGELINGQNILGLIQQLHPTPAVAGSPTEKAMEIIRQFETHDRGWYSGPVGWMDKNGDGEFCVALRSALVNEEEAHVFAGGGIMAESVPENEWKESELKLLPVISALSGGQI